MRIETDGSIFVCLPSECEETLREYGYNLYTTDDDGNMIPAADSTCEDGLFIGLGTITEMHIERLGLFNSLEDVKAYVDRYGRAPWGLSAMVRKNGWRRASEPGVSVTIKDKDGHTLRYYRRESRAVVNNDKMDSR